MSHVWDPGIISIRREARWRSVGLVFCLLTFVGHGCCRFGFSQNPSTATKTQTDTNILGYKKGVRFLVIQAEDLGMAHSIDKASFEALQNDWVTTAGVLVPAPWFPEVVRWARNHPNADLGIRLDVNSDWSSYRWRPVSNVQKGSGLTDLGGYLSSSQLYVAHHATQAEVENEERAQIGLAKTAGIPITHLDNHMRALTATPAMFQTCWKMGQEYSLPIVLPKELVRSRGTPGAKDGVYEFDGVDVNIQKLQIDRELEIMPGLAKQDWLSAYEAGGAPVTSHS